jgi:hypothetical protein
MNRVCGLGSSGLAALRVVLTLAHLMLILALGSNSAFASMPVPPRHTAERKVQLSEVVLIGTVAGIVCTRRDPMDPSRDVVLDGPECGADPRVGKLLQVKIDQVLCRTFEVALPQSVAIASPYVFDSPNEHRSRFVGKRLIFFLVRSIGPNGRPSLERPLLVPLFDYLVEPEPTDRLTEFEAAFQKHCQPR